MVYKVPFRQVICFTFKDWLKASLWCHLVLKVFPHVIDLQSDALKEDYLKHPEMFFEQYQNFIRRACGLKENTPTP